MIQYYAVVNAQGTCGGLMTQAQKDNADPSMDTVAFEAPSGIGFEDLIQLAEQAIAARG